jgi:hypothetical protein
MQSNYKKYLKKSQKVLLTHSKERRKAPSFLLGMFSTIDVSNLPQNRGAK